jgi:hypothetical protein
MAIEKAMSFDSKPEMEVAEVEMDSPEEMATLSIETLGGSVKPGDVVRLEVVSVSEEDGTAQLRYARSKPKGGIKAAVETLEEGEV